MDRTGETMTALFTRVKDAEAFEAHVTKDGGTGWNMRDVALRQAHRDVGVHQG